MTAAEGNTFEEYQFARFCHYLRTRKTPVAQPAYTFLVYEVTDAEALNALYGPLAVP